MSLTMIKLEPDMGQLIRWAERRKLLSSRREDDLGYALHALLAATFGDPSPKPFALLREPNRPAALLGYSGADGSTLRDHAATFAEPDAAEAIGLSSFAAKAMPDRWESGRRLGFSVRVRPMVRTDKNGDRSKSREVDAFVLSPPSSDRGAIYTEWLRARLPGATLEQASLDAFRRSFVSRRDAARDLKTQEGPDATLTGSLVVNDGEAFAAGLARGVGRHRAFGFGMLLLRPVG